MTKRSKFLKWGVIIGPLLAVGGIVAYLVRAIINGRW